MPFRVIVLAALGIATPVAYLTGLPWKYPLGVIIILLLYYSLRIGPTGRKGGWKAQTFADLREHFQETLFDALDYDCCMIIELESSAAHQVHLRVVRDDQKLLLLEIPKPTSGQDRLRSTLDALSGQFEGVVVEEDRYIMRVFIPSIAPYAGSIMFRAIKAGFEALGCAEDSTFARWFKRGTEGLDPAWEMKFFGQTAESTSGLLRWYSKRRAAQAQSAVRKRDEQRRGPSARDIS